jgi:hypothetical protein
LEELSFWSLCYVVLGRLLHLGELRGLGFAVSATIVRKLLREAGLGPAGERAGLSWREFLHTQAQSILAVDFTNTNRWRSTASILACARIRGGSSKA